MKDNRSLEQKIREVHQAVLEAAFDRNTKIRMKMANVGRPTGENKLAKQGEIKTKVIDEDSVAGVSTKDSAKEQPESGKKKKENNKDLLEPGKIQGGKTEVDLEPSTDDRDDDGKKIDDKSKKATKAANAQAGVKEETMNTTKHFGLPADLIAAVTEALKGGQKKLDKNHNGKIDGQDFKILRKEEVVDEERMSKGRRDALARKTSFTADPPRRLEKPEPKETKSDKIKAYRADRDKHGEMEEEVEQIDELSKGTVSSYKEKSDSELNKKAPVGPGSTFKNRMKREKGNFLANKKLSGKAKVNATEEVEFSEAELAHIHSIINEDSKDPYTSKSGKHIDSHMTDHDEPEGKPDHKIHLHNGDSVHVHYIKGENGKTKKTVMSHSGDYTSGSYSVPGKAHPKHIETSWNRALKPEHDYDD